MKALTKVKIRVQVKAIPQYILVFTNLFLIAWITDKYIEAICFSISFVSLRFKFDNILHCNTTLKCMLLSNGVIFAAIPLTLPVSDSLFGGLLIGFCVNYGANLFASNVFRNQEKLQLQVLLDEQHNREVYSMTEEQLRVYCKSYNFDYIDEEIVIQRLIYHLKGRELYDKIGYSKPQMIRREQRIEKRLNISLKDR